MMREVLNDNDRFLNGERKFWMITTESARMITQKVLGMGRLGDDVQVCAMCALQNHTFEGFDAGIKS